MSTPAPLTGGSRRARGDHRGDHRAHRKVIGDDSHDCRADLFVVLTVFEMALLLTERRSVLAGARFGENELRLVIGPQLGGGCFPCQKPKPRRRIGTTFGAVGRLIASSALVLVTVLAEQLASEPLGGAAQLGPAPA